MAISHSNNSSFKTKTESLERLALSNKPKLIISSKVQKQIDYLHKKEGQKEWSGELITKEKGTINDLDNWEITCEDIFLADIGSGAFTGYEVDKGGFKAVDIIEMYDAFPSLLEGGQKNHHIHTHHSMGAFFSGTDWDNLHDRALVSNYFLMLVVDFKKTYKAKVAFKATISSAGDEVVKFANNEDGFPDLILNGAASAKTVLVVMDCEVILPQESGESDFELAEKYEKAAAALRAIGDNIQAAVYTLRAEELAGLDPAFMDRYSRVKQAIIEENNKKTWVSSKDYNPRDYKQGQIHYGGNLRDDSPAPWNAYAEEDDLSDAYNTYDDYSDKKPKKFMEMSDKEFKDYMETNGSINEDTKVESATFKDDDVYALINSVLDDNVTRFNFSNPLKRFLEIDKTVRNRKDFAEAFVIQFEENFRAIYSHLGDEDYLYALEILITKLKRYRNCRVVDKIFDKVEEEIETVQELIND